MSHHLKDKLKTLRLSGILESLDLRISQAQSQNLGFHEFLEMLFQDEIERRESKQLTLRLRRACFEEEKTLEGFDFAFNPHVPVRQVKDLATCHFIEKKENVILCGPVGVGKTHLAQALGHHACRMGHNVLFTKAQKMFRILAAARADATWEKRLKQFVDADLLIIDDFGLKNLTPTQADDFQEIVAERYFKGAMVLTSNRQVNDWIELFPDPVFADSILDRFAHNAHQIVIEGESFRKAKRLVA